MPTWVTEPGVYMLIAVIIVVATIAGRIRREPRWMIAANAFGASACYVAIVWTGDLGIESTGPVALTAVGIYLMTIASERTRRQSREVARAS
jgi:ABC-type Mn2+/Zn2+ transport system permease subunit